jgi:hypothetical protein
MRGLIWILAAIPCFAASPDADRQVREEIDRLERALAARPITDARLTGMTPRVVDGLRSAKSALDGGRTYLALERLGQAMDTLEGLWAAGAANAVFEKAWADGDARVKAVARTTRTAPAAVIALRETAIGRTAPLLDGARGFALATAPADGLFYIGEAIGQAEFAKFCAGLKAAPAGRAWRARSMLPELIAMQEKANAAFKPPKSIELHARFISLNSAIKLARELDAAKSYHGALYQYLEAVRQYGMLDQAAIAETDKTRMRQALSSAGGRVGYDDSIATLFVERALAWAEHGEPDEWRAAQVIVSQVLPAYRKAVEGAPAAPRSTGKTVEVTLVRWPYT